MLLLAATLTIMPGITIGAGEEAQEPQWEAMAVDTVVVRPLSLASSVLGGAFFIVSLPFSAMGGNTDAAFETLVAEPVQYTFKRPLGEF